MNDLNANTIQDVHIVKNSLTHLHPYEPPTWASSLKDIPQYFVKVSVILCLVYNFYFPYLLKLRSLFATQIARSRSLQQMVQAMNNAIG